MGTTRDNSFVSENQAARRLLEAGLKDMPIYQPLGESESLSKTGEIERLIATSRNFGLKNNLDAKPSQSEVAIL